MSHPTSVKRVLRAAVFRVRVGRALRTASYAWSCVTFATAALVLVDATLFLSNQPAWLGVAIAIVAASGWLGAATTVQASAVARRIDRHYGLADNVQNYLEFSAKQQSPFVVALLSAVEREAARLRAHEVVHLEWRMPALHALLGCSLLVLSLISRSPSAGSVGEQKKVLKDGASTISEPTSAADDVSVETVRRELARRGMSRETAIDALLKLEQAQGRSLSSRIHAALATTAQRSNPLRYLDAIRERIVPTMSNEQREQLAALIEQKRRELDRLRAELANRPEQRTLEHLDNQLASAESALRNNRLDEAREQVDQAQRSIEQQRQQERQASEQTAELREFLQRQATPDESSQHAAAGQSAGTPEQTTPDERQTGAAMVREQVTSGGSSAGSSEPDLFQGRVHKQTKTEQHAASSQLNEGVSRSEVIITAAEHGFASAPYKRVYGDYRQHAEELMQRDQVPAPRRYYVRRYFSRIQPRAAEAVE